MEGLVLLEPTELYNMLQQATVYSNLSDQNYLLLIDARNKHDYNESHVVTAKKAPKNKVGDFFVPFDAELECKQNVVVYDSHTRHLKDISHGTQCGKLFWEMGCKNKVYILKGGYEEFSALYPFLRTQKIIYMPKELDVIKPYPTEIIPGFLYLGNWSQVNSPYILKDLKIKAHLNCCMETENLVPEPDLLHIPCEDSSTEDLTSKFDIACTFIECHRKTFQPVLVFSTLGISRAPAFVIAHLIQNNNWTVADAFNHVKKCCSSIQPNMNFMAQLQQWSKTQKS